MVLSKPLAVIPFAMYSLMQLIPFHPCEISAACFEVLLGSENFVVMKRSEALTRFVEFCHMSGNSSLDET
jgi:hypothetical protein